MILMACAVAMLATAQAKPVDNAKLSIHKNNIKVWTYQNSQNPVFLYKAETTYDTPFEKAVGLILRCRPCGEMGAVYGQCESAIAR